tara:strand:- start:596 stop:715 length:120 start_codon:yes stop_codon:yes gene_type:complete
VVVEVDQDLHLVVDLMDYPVDLEVEQLLLAQRELEILLL